MLMLPDTEEMWFCRWYRAILITSILRLEYVVQTANLSAIAYNVCANNAFCKWGSDSVPSGQYSCCSPCSCEKDCYVRNQCCPDSGIDNGGGPQLTCKSMYDHFNKNRGIPTRIGIVTDNYFVVDSCSDEFNDTDVISGCLSPRTIAEHVFVTDPVSTIIYKNFQCAICNGVSTYESWDLKITCAYGDALYSATDREKFILSNCRFDSMPKPSSVSPNYKWPCFPDAIDTCNVTGEWEAYDADLYHACALYNEPFMTQKFSRLEAEIKIYKNVFCFYCNSKKGTPTNPICSLPMGQTPLKGLSMIPFQALIRDFSDVSLKHEESASETERICQVNEMVDPIMGCSVMLCPFGLIPIYGRCVSILRDANVTLAAAFEYQLVSLRDNESVVVPSPDDPLYDEVLERFTRLFTQNNCKACTPTVYPDIIYVTARSSPECPLVQLAKLFEHATKTLRMRNVNGSAALEIRIWLSSRYSHDEEPNRITLRNLTPIRKLLISNCELGAILQPKFYCKRIQFSLMKMKANCSNATIASLLDRAEPSHFINGIAHNYVICVNDYLEIVNGGSSPLATSYMLVFSVCGILLWYFILSE